MTHVETPYSPSISAGPDSSAQAKQSGGEFRAFLRLACQGLCLLALALTSYFLISRFVVQSVQIVGVSMAPTLQDSRHYLLNRWIYYVRGPKPMDVVVLRDPIDKGFAVKRIIGRDGDSIYLRDGTVYLNGQELQENYLPAGTPTFPYSQFKEQSFKCGKDQYFVLGDNRMNSADSRTYGLIARRNILGLVIR
jgi:signal peptidase I